MSSSAMVPWFGDTMYLYALITFAVSLVTAASLYPSLMRILCRENITGRDVNKPDRPVIPEMGGLAIIGAYTIGIVTAIGLDNFALPSKELRTDQLMGTLSTVLILGILGICDDLFDLGKSVKMVAPAIAALPLAALRVGETHMVIPGLGSVEFGLLYPLLILPIGLTGAANASNILAGFNGLEAGMGLIASLALSVIMFTQHQVTPLIVFVALAAPLLVTLRHNWYPAKVFVGDAGTLTIGGVICTGSVLANLETAGMLVLIPHAVDFVIKACHGLPSSGWWGEFREGKLYCPKDGPVGLCQLIMKLRGGVTEVELVLLLLLFEFICSCAAVALYARF